MKVEIRNLQAGSNRFEFTSDVSDLDLSERNIEFLEIAIESLIDKGEENIVVTNRVRVNAKSECENCLCKYDDVLNEEYTLIYTSNRDTVEHDDEEVLRYLGKTTRELDLTAGLTESLRLAMPMRLLCKPDCKGLCPSCGADLNERQCDCKTEQIDPRWEGLKKLLD